jgi:hypothetical protein
LARDLSATSRACLAVVKRLCLKTLDIASAQAEIAKSLRIGTLERRFATYPRRLGCETELAFGGEPNDRASNIGAVRSPLFESLA